MRYYWIMPIKQVQATTIWAGKNYSKDYLEGFNPEDYVFHL